MIDAIFPDHKNERDNMTVVKDFFKSEAAGGIVLMAAALAALIVANSVLYPWYSNLLYAPTGPVLSEKLGPMNVHLWVNDGLMACPPSAFNRQAGRIK